MTFAKDTIAQIRYGHGLTPDGPRSAAELLAELTRPDPMPATAGPDIVTRMHMLREYSQIRKNGGDQMMSARLMMRERRAFDFRDVLVRTVRSPAAFRERLVAFWGDHFTVSARNQQLAISLPAYWDEAIRPNITTRFRDILWAAVTHPAMLYYLDQKSSYGPNSPAGQKTGRGLNENLARELMELHTLGVDSNYTQADVRQLALVLAGLNFNADGFKFSSARVEPGLKTVLGRSYGGGDPSLDTIQDAVHDLAARPETAAHIARKLAVHFIGHSPDPDLIGQMTTAFRDSDGDLMQVYSAMLSHPAAWTGGLTKMKPPFDYVASILRALDAPDLETLGVEDINHRIGAALIAMGQQPFRPKGPDGWPEDDAGWITPATLTARLEFAADAAKTFAQDRDPRRFVVDTLAEAASDSLRFAATAAETKWEGIALVFASPEFNRR